MSEDDLRRYVEKSIAKGWSLEEIKSSLLNAGYKEGEVEEVFAQMKSESKEETRFPRSYLFPAVGVIIILILSSIFYFGFPSEDTEIKEQPKKLEFSCEELESFNTQQACKICKKIEDSSTYNICLAIVANKSRGCELTSNGGGSCYALLALRTGNKGYCEKARVPVYCQALLEENFERCEEISSSFTSPAICYLDFALIENDSEICNEIKSVSGSVCCKALVTKKKNLCNQISHLRTRNYCFLRLALEKREPSFCEETNLTSTKVETCKALAERKFSSLDCTRERKDICFEFIPFVQNSSSCAKIPKVARDDCFKVAAFNKFSIFQRKLIIPQR